MGLYNYKYQMLISALISDQQEFNSYWFFHLQILNGSLSSGSMN
jgi:hypothetical protein